MLRDLHKVTQLIRTGPGSKVGLSVQSYRDEQAMVPAPRLLQASGEQGMGMMYQYLGRKGPRGV